MLSCSPGAHASCRNTHQSIRRDAVSDNINRRNQKLSLLSNGRNKSAQPVQATREGTHSARSTLSSVLDSASRPSCATTGTGTQIKKRGLYILCCACCVPHTPSSTLHSVKTSLAWHLLSAGSTVCMQPPGMQPPNDLCMAAQSSSQATTLTLSC